MGAVWVKFKTRAAREWASDFHLSLDMRMWALGAGRVRPGGHAIFDKGEIRAKLRRLNESSGEVSLFTERRLNAALAKGKLAGLFAPPSSLRCLVYPLDSVEIGLSLPAMPCPEHGHNMSWLEDRWIDTSEPETARLLRAVRTLPRKNPVGSNTSDGNAVTCDEAKFLSNKRASGGERTVRAG